MMAGLFPLFSKGLMVEYSGFAQNGQGVAHFGKAPSPGEASVGRSAFVTSKQVFKLEYSTIS